MGARQPLEWMGQASESWTLNAKLYPARFRGASTLAVLAAVRASGLSQFMLRGDGSLMGWVVIEQVVEKSTILDRNGVGKVIDVTINRHRSRQGRPNLQHSTGNLGTGRVTNRKRLPPPSSRFTSAAFGESTQNTRTKR